MMWLWLLFAVTVVALIGVIVWPLLAISSRASRDEERWPRGLRL